MSLSDVIGQPRAIHMLDGVMRKGKIASSYLFCGEQGTGKKFTAINLAKALNCLDPKEMGGMRDSCDRCASCKRIDSGSHPDFIVIGPSETGQIKIEEIRRLEEMLSMKAFESGTKAAIVDDAETMNQNAANAFLKTLEEPAAGSLIILVSSRPDMLPETIRSRCSRVNFAPLSPSDCKTVIGKDDPVLLGLSMGRPGLALGEDLGKVRGRFLDTFTKAGDKHPWKGKDDTEEWFDMALVLLRDMAVFKITKNPEDLINKDLRDMVQRLGDGASLEDIIASYREALRLRGLLGFNLNKGITWSYIMDILSLKSKKGAGERPPGGICR